MKLSVDAGSRTQVFAVPSTRNTAPHRKATGPSAVITVWQLHRSPLAQPVMAE